MQLLILVICASGCKNLESFKGNLTGIKNALNLFNGCTKLDFTKCDFGSEEPFTELTEAQSIFSGCSMLTNFNYNIDKVSDGNGMFIRCPNFTSFGSKLPGLTVGFMMFYGCKLDKPSVMNIINSLRNENQAPQTTNNTIMEIGIDATLKTDSELLTFLGISKASSSHVITVTNPLGAVWTITIRWN